jgi:hypothetical protein
VSWPIQDHCAAFLTLVASAPGGPPSLKVFDGSVTADALFGGGVFSADPPYVLVYFSIETPDGLTVPEWLSLTLTSVVINARAIVHCVGVEPEGAKAARAVAGRVRAAVLDQTLTVAGYSCNPVRWIEGQPPQRNEEVPGTAVFDVVDVYGWTATSG